MNLMAGLDTPDQGQRHLQGVTDRRPGPERGVIFQSYS
ncbi:hypothetical protein [Hoeflea alexandrii]